MGRAVDARVSSCSFKLRTGKTTREEMEMATHSSVLAWRIQGMGCTESDTTEVT